MATLTHYFLFISLSLSLSLFYNQSITVVTINLIIENSLIMKTIASDVKMFELKKIGTLIQICWRLKMITIKTLIRLIRKVLTNWFECLTRKQLVDYKFCFKVETLLGWQHILNLIFFALFWVCLYFLTD